VYRPYGHVSALYSAQPLHLGLRRVDLSEDPPGANDEQFPSLRQRDPSRRALHEWEADLVLEATELL
jgi:hypothetical protein